jgi:UDP:flavonoid glycosyltransferase YjiC (YdhE family)
MKILLAAIPATGHFNPVFVAARILKEAGHETAIYTSVVFRDKIEKAGMRFFPLPEDVDQGWRDFLISFFEEHKVTPAPDEGGKAYTRFFADPMISQSRGLQAVLKTFPAEVLIHETMFTGVLPMLLGPRFERPASVYLGITALPLERADGAPWGLGLPPTDDPKMRKEYAEIKERQWGPMTPAANKMLGEIGLPPLPASLLASNAMLADLILQPCTPGFEFLLRKPEEKLHFIGALLPGGAGDVPDQIKEAKKAGRTIILVSQGTVANNDLGKLLAPTIRGLGDRQDFLILATTGGAPIEKIPCTLSANTVASKYLHFGEILLDVDVLVALGSFGTVTQALSFGVPMVVAGKGEDKPEVGARVTWTGAGINLATDTPTPGQIRAAVDQILTNPDYRACAQRLRQEFASYDSTKILPRSVEALVASRMSSPQSL